MSDARDWERLSRCGALAWQQPSETVRRVGMISDFYGFR